MCRESGWETAGVESNDTYVALGSVYILDMKAEMISVSVLGVRSKRCRGEVNRVNHGRVPQSESDSVENTPHLLIYLGFYEIILFLSQWSWVHGWGGEQGSKV